MNFRSFVRFRCIVAGCLIAGWPASGAELRVVCEVDGRALPLVSADTTKILVHDADGVIPAPAVARWRLEGSRSAILETFDWLTDYTVRRSQRRDADIDPHQPFAVEGNLIHKRSLDAAGNLIESPVLRLWPSGLDSSSAVVFVWLLGNDVAHVDVRPMPKPEDYLHFMVTSERRFHRDEAALCRLGLAIFKDGRFLPPVPSFSEPVTQRAIAALVLDDVALLKSAVADGADPRSPGRDGRPLYFAAVQLGATQGCEALLELDPTLAHMVLPESGETPLHVAAYYNRHRIAEMLLAAGAEPDPKKNKTLTPMWIAAHYGHAEVVRTLIHHGVSATETLRGTMPLLSTAIESGDAETAEALCDAGATTGSMSTALVTAASRGRSEMVRWIIGRNHPDTIKQGGNSAVYFASEEKGDADIIRALISARAPVDARDQHGNHALHAAVKRGAFAIAAELLAEGASVDARDAHGQTALHHAATFNLAEAVSLLLDHKAVPAAENNDKLQPLELALLGGARDAANALAHRAIELDLGRPQAGRCLSAAIRMDLLAVLKNALDSGWSYASEVEPGWPALRVAEVCKADRVASLLVEAGASLIAAETEAVIGAGKLDAPLKLLRSKTPEAPRNAAGQLQASELIIDLIIDQNGKARFPRLRGDTGGLDLRHVFDAVETWEFAVPQQAGRAVVTAAAVPLRFKHERRIALLEADELPQLIHRIEPEYSSRTLKSRTRSTALLWAVVGTTGAVDEVKVLRETGPGIGEAVVAAVRQWRFTPAKLNGQPVAVGLEIPFVREP